MQDTADTLPAHPERNRSSRRSRPSLAAFTDSGYAPTQRSSQNQPYKQTSTIGRSQTRSTISFAVPVPDDRNADGSDPVDLGVASQLADESFASLRASLRGMSDIIRTYRGYDGPEESDTMRRNGGTARKDGTGRFAHRPGPTNSSGSSQYPKASTISRSATISSAWSGVSNRLFVESLREPSSDAGHNTFTESFDKLARKHGIQPFPKDFSKELGSVSVSSGSRASSADSTSTLPGNKLWNKLLGRTPHTVDISKHHGNSKLSIRHRRKNSMGDLTGFVKGKRDMLKGMHLEDMIRLGGVAVFNLPRGLSPGDLLIPTCIHAAATHILNHGLRKQGIFRVSGNINTTFALYDYYQRQLEENNNEAVVATTALARLPPNIDYTIHDVAHLLKKLIYGLPGGLLGSTAVFQALYNVNCYVFPDPSLDDEKTHQVKPRMIALALSAINLHFRISLMCSIFGLLRAINLASEQETRSKVKDPHETFVHLRDDALGVVFGPLLLGDKSHHILVDEVEDRGGLLVLPTIDHNTHTSAQKKKGKPEFHEAKKSMERTRRASLVTQMLIDHWEEIAYQMKRLDTLGITAQAYDLPAPQQQNTIKKGQFKFIEKEIRISDSYHTERAPPPDMTAYETVHSNPYEQLPFVEETGTARRRRRSSTRRDPGNPARSQTPQEDLMRFDSYRGARKPLDRNLFIPPPDLDRTARPEMSPIAESFSTRLQTPSMGGVESSPNWTQIFTPPHSATFPPEDSPNWRVVGTPQHDEPEKSSNWHQFPSQQDTLPEESPNWRSISTNSVQPRILQSSPTIHEFPTPGPKESQGSPNWLTIGTPKTPQGPVTASSPNWTEFPTPRVSIENSPNWRLIGTDNESDIPDTPIRRTYTIPYAQAEPEETPKVAEADNISIASSRVTRSSGTSSGARTPTEEVIPELATKNPRSAQPKFSTSEFLAGVMTPPEEMTPQLAARPKRDLTFSSSEISALELRGRTEDEARTDSEAPQKRPSRWGRRAISPVPETRYDTGNVVSEPEPTPTEITRPTTPKPLTFRKKPAGFSIYEDEEETTPKADDLNDDSPILTLRKPNSQADVKLIPRGRRPIPSRPVTAPESSSNLNSVPLQPSSPNRKPRTSVDSDPEEQYLSTERETDSPTKRRGGNSALYAEIRRLQRLVDLRTEEANSTKKELELAQNMANAGTLSHIVRETQEELKVWKNRAEWAEKQLRQLTPSPTSSLGHSHRSSVS